jgi:plastocyanin
MNRPLIALPIAALLALAACGGEAARESPDASRSPTADAAPATPAPDGKTIIVEMETAEDGTNKFEPSTIEAKKGDLIRFTLETGVHNVNFLPDSNTIKTGLPPASDLLQLPGQTYDLVVTLEPGTYYFQCDPHALLGMIGHLIVKP